MNAAAIVSKKAKPEPLILPNPCTCDLCCEKDAEGDPVIYLKYKTVRDADGELVPEPIPGTEYRKSFRVSHWVCDRCGNRFPFANAAGGRLPARTTQKAGMVHGEAQVHYDCGMCGPTGRPEVMAAR